MSLALRFARRELRSGVSGFRIFLACLALGVAALAAAGSTAEAFRQGLASQTRQILGGDLAVSVEGRRFTAHEQAAMAAFGRVTDSLAVRAMAAGAGPSDRRLAEVRGVDPAFPLAGTVKLSPDISLAEAVAVRDGRPGAAVDPRLLARLHLDVGGMLLIGDAPFVVRARLDEEPDRLGRGFALGPSVMISRAVLERSGLLAGDALFGETVRIALPAGVEAKARLQALQRALGTGVRARGRNEAAAGLSRLIDQLEFFLGFIGLAALLAGGLGVSSAVSAYLNVRRPAIAVLKALGADGALIRNVYLLQIGALTLTGVVIGLLIGAAAPFLLGAVVRDRLPVPVLFALYPAPLLRAGLFGLLAAAAFSLAPLGRARATRPSSLFRQGLDVRLPLGVEAAGLVLAALGLIGLVTATAPSRAVAAAMLAGVLAGFLLLWLIGRAAAALAGRLRGLARGAVRIGLANLASPGSAARTASPSIGFGVALLTTVVLIQSSLLAEVREVAPNTAPALVMTQIPEDRAAAFDADVAAALGPLSSDIYQRYPFATGRLTAVDGRPVKERVAPGGRWAFDQDVTMTALDGPPPEGALTAGEWWPKGYAGPPVVVLDDVITRPAHIRVGETATISVLGRDVEAKVMGVRKVEWGRFGASFPIVLNAAALRGASLRQIAIAKADRSAEARLLARLGHDFPGVNVISVREALEAAAKIFDQLAWAVRGAAAVAALAGLLVLIGAVASSAQARAREAAILKVLGASRGLVLCAYGVEYGAVGAIAGLAGVLLGAAAAYPVIAFVFHARFAFDGAGLGAVLAGTAATGAAVGAVAAFIALARRPAPVLRAE